MYKLENFEYYRNTLDKWCELVKENSQISSEKYGNYKVKRGLRNSDGTGVLAGLTNIGNVHGYVISEDEALM